ncbi:hypothetical protein BDV36DRAFT_274235 [Aspergillus pseudocaelatus]|uniref:Uncharacterized protein n=1 Tax=Aspergillus pseudocaelatus TaxID=1825620 RepID=A0ABQ6W363_9EURO|nr:hypothetical protein BDV36DRAFT_274235 [Aspergillus pseudocaelatus]
MQAVLTQRLLEVELLSVFIVWDRVLGFPRGPLNVEDSIANSGLFSAEPSFMLVKSTQECSDKAYGQSGACLSNVGGALDALILNGCRRGLKTRGDLQVTSRVVRAGHRDPGQLFSITQVDEHRSLKVGRWNEIGRPQTANDPQVEAGSR